MKPENLTIEHLEKASGKPADTWHGACTLLAAHACEAVGGAEVYGMYAGPVSLDGYWGDRPQLNHHGWVQLEDGRILDPTRWSFENVKPYVYISEPSDEYDEGSDGLRMRLMKPCPDPSGTLPGIEFRAAEKTLIERLTGTHASEVSLGQLVWMANLPYQILEQNLATGVVYTMLIANDLSAFIPLDNKLRAIREGRIEAACP